MIVIIPLLIGLKALWRTAVSVEKVSETDIEQYLKNGLCGLASYVNHYIYVHQPRVSYILYSRY